MTHHGRVPKPDQHVTMSDPFATPIENHTSSLPASPSAVAHKPTRPSYPPFDHSADASSLGWSQTDVIAYPYKSASMSSGGTGSTTTPVSSVELEKNEVDKPVGVARTPRNSLRDPEKAAAQSLDRQSRVSRDRTHRDSALRVSYWNDDEDPDEETNAQEKNALKILLFLALPVVLLSGLNAIWALISLVITTMSQPVRLCARRPTFGQQLGGLVGPALNLQLKSIYTPLSPHADEDATYRPGRLMLVMLLSPFLSMGMAIAAWVVAVYWASSAVVGDPAGTDKRDDGRDTVLALRRWWETWHMRSVREA